MSFKTPAIGMSGVYQVEPPWTLLPGKVYRCSGHRTFEQYIVSGEDPVEKVYAPVGLTEVEYLADSTLAGILVVTLVTEDGDTLSLPNKYIIDYPESAIVPHSWYVLTLSLGMLPDDYNLQRIEAAAKEAVSDYIGVEPNVFVVKKKIADVVTEAMAQQLYAIRQAAIRNRNSTYADKRYLEQQILELRAQNSDLITIIEALQSNP